MQSFRVTFFKVVCSDTGQDVDASQGSFEVRAVDETAAIGFAKQKFCRARRIGNWHTNADHFEVEPLAGRSLSIHTSTSKANA